jgi:myo-inositol-1(or 4)-monophosphatase
MTQSLGQAAVLVAEAAAREAGEILLKRFGRLDARRIGQKSARRDLVTEADLESERCLVAHLRRAFPDHAIEAEEEVHDADDDRPRWFLDPLDGTVNFVHGLPLFAVSLGLFAGGEPEAAVVHAPRLGETFTAARGAGAFLDGVRLSVSRASELCDCVLATGFPYRRGELAHDNLENFRGLFYEVRDLRRLGSAALDLAFTAAGRFDGYWELHLAPHDVAAGGLLVREAGGIVSDASGGPHWLRGKSVIAASAPIHRALLGRIAHDPPAFPGLPGAC